MQLSSMQTSRGAHSIKTVPDARIIGIDEVPDGYRAMNEREAIKVMIQA
jgi:threonine dehydrogenase-like Zn-dependent dehydrogenase